MSSIFISFPPAAGGNHLRNILTLATDLFDPENYKQSMVDQYRAESTISVHGEDYASNMSGNINALKLHRALMNPGVNWLLYGHFAEIYSFRNDISTIKDKKFIILSPDTDACKNIWLTRATQLGMQPCGDYYIGEQVFLYEAFIYYDMFKTKKSNVMNISISEWFNANVDSVFASLESFLNTNIDRKVATQMHATWLSRQKF